MSLHYENTINNCHGKTGLHYLIFVVIRSEDFVPGTRSASPSEYDLCAVGTKTLVISLGPHKELSLLCDSSLI